MLELMTTLSLLKRLFFDNAWYTPSRLVKQSQALRGRNLTRDNWTDSAPMVHPGPWRITPLGAFVFLVHRTPELCL
jgi:hypothetical protein